MNTHLVLHHRIAGILNCTTERIRILNIIEETLNLPALPAELDPGGYCPSS